jgi:hypothetical protein
VRFFVHIDVPDFLVHELGPDLERYIVRHAKAEIRLNGCTPAEEYSFNVSMLPDDPCGLTNFSRAYLEIKVDGGFAAPWQTMRYPGREAYQSRLNKSGT